MIMAKDSNNNYVKIEDIKQQNSFNGVSPIKFKGSGENLENYRIYGNTIGGESVGDRTANLFDGNFLQGYWVYADGGFIYVNTWICTNKIPCTGGQAYTYSFSQVSRWFGFVWYDGDGNYISTNNLQNNSDVHYRSYSATSPANAAYMVVNIAGYPSVGATIYPADVTDFMLVEGSTALPYEPYGYKVPVTVEGKNLLQNTATSQTINGVTFTVNDDGSITCNGTAEQIIFLSINNYIRIDGNVILSGCPDGGGSDSYMLRINSSGTITARDQGSGANAINPRGMVEIRIASGYTCNNVTFYPMIRKADIENDTYEPYHAPVTTNIYIPEQLKMVGDKAEYVDYKEQKQYFADGTSADVELPALPTLSGTNTLSVGTEIKPSKVWGRLSDPRDIEYVKDNLGNILFSKYHEVEDEPPLTFKAKKEGALKDYRIYGNTVNGESVGDRTRNLFDGEIERGSFNGSTGEETNSNIRVRSGKVRLTADNYTINADGVSHGVVYVYALNGDFIRDKSITTWTELPMNFEIGISYDVRFCFRKNDNSTLIPSDIMNIMLNSDSEPLPYEPYGYSVPVTVEGKNLFDEKYDAISPNIIYKAIYIGNNICTLSTDMPLNNALGANLFLLTGNVSTGASTPTNGVYVNHSKTVASTNGYVTIAYRHYDITPIDYHTQLEKGSTATAYEPYRTPVTTPIYLPEQIRKVGDEAEYVDYSAQKMHRVRKNLLKNTATSQTINGVTFTVNNDGSVTCNGTASSTAFFAIAEPVNLSKNIVSGCPRNGSSNSYLLRYQQYGGSYVEDKGNGVLIPDYGDSRAIIRINAGYICTNLTFYPMIRKADIADNTYEPYIADTELDVTLPAIPTLSGTNTLSVGTEVQPSEVYIKGKIKEIN